MNDEIKEINIKIPGQILDYVDTKEHLLNLFNYITNLQQENEELKSQIEYANKINNEAINRKNNYKSRIEKAVEKLKKIQQNAIKYGAEHDVIICQELIDTLNCRSDE